MKDHYLTRTRHRRDVVFTRSEINDQKYCVADAVQAAKVILEAKRLPRQPAIEVKLSALNGRSLDEKISIYELNRIQDHLVTESLYGAGAQF